MFQATTRRLTGPLFSPPLIVTAKDFRFIVSEQLAAISAAAAEILVEPCGKNTAAAVAAAALALEEAHGDCLFLVAPSDHAIPDSAKFRSLVQKAAPTAQEGQLVTFGVCPDRAETGYGWLELSRTPSTGETPSFCQPLRSFVEKPDSEKARALLAGGMHLWNAGIFLFTVKTILRAFETHTPEILRGVRDAFTQAKRDLSFLYLDSSVWSSLPEKSIDYAVMEKAENLSVCLFDGAWSDLGGWEAVWRETPRDRDGVVTFGPAIALDCTNTLLRSESNKLRVVGIGLKDIAVIAMPDAVLVSHIERSQDVKHVVARLKEEGALQAESFPHEYRPWGYFESLVSGARFQVKRIVVKPGGRLSLQSHHHRAEHWIIVEGTALVTVGEKVELKSENEAVYVPLGTIHRIENPGKVPLVLVEIQTGSYLGEDDIVRYEDIYARN